MKIGRFASSRMLVDYITAQVDASASIADALRVMAKVLLEVSGWVWGEVWLARASGVPIRCADVFVAGGIGDEEARLLDAFKAASLVMMVENGEGTPGICLQEGVPVWVDHLLNEQNFLRKYLIKNTPLRRGVFIPFRDGERVLGVVALMDRPEKDTEDAAIEDLSDDRHHFKEMLREAYEPIAKMLARRRQQIEFSHLFDVSADLMCVMGFDGFLKHVNPAFTKVLGWPKAYFLNNPLFHLLHPDDLERAQQAMQTVAFIQPNDRFEARYACADGSWRWLSWSGTPVVEEALLYLVARDVTIQREAQAQLQQSEQRFRYLARATSDAIWDWDMVQDTLWWSEGFGRIFGYPTNSAPQNLNAWAEFVHPNDCVETINSLGRIVDQPEITDWSHEYRFRRSDGTYAWVHDRGYIIRDDTGRAIRMVGGITDRSEHKQAEIRSRRQAERLDQTSDAVVAEDLQGVVRYWNNSAALLFGFEKSYAVGYRAEHLFSLDPVVGKLARDTVLREGLWSGELTIRLSNRREIMTDARWTLVCDDQQRPAEILTVYTNITEKKHLEAQYLRAQRLESIGTLAGGIAHDVNNVLAPIPIATTMLRMTLNDLAATLPPNSTLINDCEEFIATIETCTRRGADTIQRILTFARGTPNAPFRPLDPASVLQEIFKLLRESFPRSIHISTYITPDLPQINGDPTQIHQILLNLAINARDAMPNGGTLILRVALTTIDTRFASANPDARPGPYVVFSVHDTGTGIPADALNHLFEPFFTTKPPGQGTGLGLPTALTLARSHQGFLLVHSYPDEGSTFELYIPPIESIDIY